MRKIIEAKEEYIEIIAKNNMAMAKETENKELDIRTVKNGVKAVLEDPQKGKYYLYVENGEIIGQLMITYEWSDWRNCFFCWIQSVYTIPEKRGTGVFNDLFNKVLEEVKNSKGCGIRLYVDKNNKIARKVYENLKMFKTNYFLYELEF